MRRKCGSAKGLAEPPLGGTLPKTRKIEQSQQRDYYLLQITSQMENFHIVSD
jgi:hypothetical protein